MSEPIYSTGNTKIKELVKLRESPKHRRKLKHFVIEGYADLKCIYDFGRKIEISENRDFGLLGFRDPKIQNP